jgi:hypothetical protein
MTKKDFEKIAAILKRNRESTTLVTDHLFLNQITSDFAVMLAEDNPRFDRKRFLEAAGISNEE